MDRAAAVTDAMLRVLLELESRQFGHPSRRRESKPAEGYRNFLLTVALNLRTADISYKHVRDLDSQADIHSPGFSRNLSGSLFLQPCPASHSGTTLHCFRAGTHSDFHLAHTMTSTLLRASVSELRSRTP